MKASEVLKRYAAGESNFQRRNLRGQSFKGKDLSGADFSEADIRSANFTGANLRQANFTGAEAGLGRKWRIILSISSFLLSFFSGLLATFGGIGNAAILGNEFREEFGIGVGLTGIAIFVILIFLLALKSKKIITYLVISLISLFIVIVLLIMTTVMIGKVAGNSPEIAKFFQAYAFVIIATMIVVVLGVGTHSLSLAVVNVEDRKPIEPWGGFILSFMASSYIGIEILDANVTFSNKILDYLDLFGFATIYVLCLAILAGLVYGYSLKRIGQYILINQFAIVLAAMRGTNFGSADLTDANFSSARLKSTDMREANLTRVRWYGAKMLDRVRPGDTYLKNAQVRQWLIGKGTEKNFDGEKLQGINLQGANLTDASFIGTDLGEANLIGATLTGACIQDWNINSQTKLDDVICDYVYLKEGQQERLPHDLNRTFKPGEFTKYIEKALNTVDLIFTDGINWGEFLKSFKELQDEYGEENVGVQAIEKKSDGAFVIRLTVPPDANKAEIESQIKQSYETKLQVLEAWYLAQLQAKDETIATKDETIATKDETIAAKDETIASLKYHQQGTDMDNIVKILGSLSPSTINNIISMTSTTTSTAESTSMSETNQSKYDLSNANVGGIVDTAQSGSHQEFTQHNYPPEQKQTLAQAAGEIQKLLKQLEKNNHSATEADMVAYVNDETTPSFKRRAAAALKAAGETAIDEFLDNPYVKVGKAAIMGWME